VLYIISTARDSEAAKTVALLKLFQAAKFANDISAIRLQKTEFSSA